VTSSSSSSAAAAAAQTFRHQLRLLTTVRSAHTEAGVKNTAYILATVNVGLPSSVFITFLQLEDREKCCKIKTSFPSRFAAAETHVGR